MVNLLPEINVRVIIKDGIEFFKENHTIEDMNSLLQKCGEGDTVITFTNGDYEDYYSKHKVVRVKNNYLLQFVKAKQTYEALF